MPQPPLSLPEEIMLLALSRQTGAIKGGQWFDQLLAGAVLAEAFAQERLSLAREGKKHFVVAAPLKPTGDALLDEWLQKIKASAKRRQLDHWLNKVAGTRDLKHRIARRLQQRGIVGASEETVLWLFTRKRYPELDSKPEEALRARLHAAIFKDGAKVDERTAVLVSILHRGDILKRIFGAREMRSRKKHLQALIASSVIGQTTAKVIESIEAAFVVVIAASVAASAAS